MLELQDISNYESDYLRIKKSALKQMPETSEQMPMLQNINEVNSLDEEEDGDMSNYRPRNSSRRPTFSNSLGNLNEPDISSDRTGSDRRVNERYENDRNKEGGRERFGSNRDDTRQMRPDSDGGLSSVQENRSDLYGSKMINRSRAKQDGIKRSR